MDIHFWKDCPMLIICPQCEQTIEILALNDHLLKECEVGGTKQCDRCLEAIPTAGDEYEIHVEEQSCQPAKPPNVANRCPLCHEDIPPGMKGWQ